MSGCWVIAKKSTGAVLSGGVIDAAVGVHRISLVNQRSGGGGGGTERPGGSEAGQ